MQLSETMSSKRAIRWVPEKQEKVNAHLNAKTLIPHAHQYDVLSVFSLLQAKYVGKDTLKSIC